MQGTVRELDRGKRLERLFDDHSRALLAYALRRTSAADAADVLSETMLVAWRRIEDVPAGHEARFWLLGVARNVLANQARSESRRSRLGRRLREQVTEAFADASLPDTGGGPVAAALQSLPPAEREILELVAWDELEPSEAAVVLSISPAAARTRLHRARTRLREALDPSLAGGKRTADKEEL